MRPESGLLITYHQRPVPVAEGHLSWLAELSLHHSPLGHQSDPFEPQKPDHVIALFEPPLTFHLT